MIGTGGLCFDFLLLCVGRQRDRLEYWKYYTYLQLKKKILCGTYTIS